MSPLSSDLFLTSAHLGGLQQDAVNVRDTRQPDAVIVPPKTTPARRFLLL